MSEICEKLGLQVIAFVGGAGRQAGFHCVSQGELVAVEEEQNCLYQTSEGELEREQAVSAHYEQVVSGVSQGYLQGRSFKLLLGSTMNIRTKFTLTRRF